jgi:hypothetical protein
VPFQFYIFSLMWRPLSVSYSSFSETADPTVPSIVGAHVSDILIALTHDSLRSSPRSLVYETMASSRSSGAFALSKKPSLADILQAIRMYVSTNGLGTTDIVQIQRHILYSLSASVDSSSLFPITRSWDLWNSSSTFPIFLIDLKQLYRRVERAVINLTFKIPALRQKADAQIAEALKSIDEKIGSLPPGMTSYRKLPKVGMANDQIISELEQ